MQLSNSDRQCSDTNKRYISRSTLKTAFLDQAGMSETCCIELLYNLCDKSPSERFSLEFKDAWHISLVRQLDCIIGMKSPASSSPVLTMNPPCV